MAFRFEITDCPRCQNYHHEDIVFPPVLHNLVTNAKEQECIGVIMPYRFTCPTTAKAYEVSAAIYRPYTNLRAIDLRAWPYEADSLIWVGARSLDAVRLQLGEAEAAKIAAVEDW